VGIDLAADHFSWGRDLAAEIGRGSGRALPVSFVVSDGRALAFADASFDLVVADNLFEHIPSPEQLMRESLRVLRPGGQLLVPNFSSIMSKYGLHLKNGLRLPWLNLFLDEATIIEALRRRAGRRPELLGMYPGLARNPQRIAEVRRHGDLNEITHSAFIELAAREGFEVAKFNVHGTRLGRWLTRLSPQLERTRVLDVLSTGAAAVLRKPAGNPSAGAGDA
jgi:ubiquinone/menaquinone biosynthesis C-methylase UbiE